jgi:drug/metabolite transporter (DMT)-like permease
VKPQDLAELVLLAAIWGASFLFMRIGAGEFGAVGLTGLRVTLAATLLLPLLRWRGQWPALRQHWRPIAVVGIVNSALPFVAFSFAALHINAGLSSIFNATAPLWGGLIAWAWLNDRPSGARALGLAIGFAGVLLLGWDKAGLKTGDIGAATWAVLACLGATLGYGFAANYTKRKLAGVSPLAVAAGSQTAAALVLGLPTLLWWPAVLPSANAWWSLLALGFVCTGLAYLLYFRLIAHTGPTKAITVTYLIPLFGLLWGGLFLGERVSPAMWLGGGVILLGTMLSTGALNLSVWQRRRSS